MGREWRLSSTWPADKLHRIAFPAGQVTEPWILEVSEPVSGKQVIAHVLPDAYEGEPGESFPALHPDVLDQWPKVSCIVSNFHYLSWTFENADRLFQGDHSPYQIKFPDFSSGAGNISSIRSFNGSQLFHINYNRPATIYHYFSSNG